MNVADDLSIQLYSLRAYGDLDRQLDSLAAIGFRLVETVGGHLADATATRTSLDKSGLAAPTGHVGLADLRHRLDWVVDQARIVGIEHLFMPAVPAEDRAQPADAWRAVGAELGELAERLAGHGLALGYHNHAWELETFPDGRVPLELLLEGAAGSRLTFEADLGWIVRGGGDPIAWLERLEGRLAAVHVKDLAPAGQNGDQDGWSDVGRGTLDWPRLWPLSLSHGARWMVLEHDRPADPVGFARNSRDFLLGLAT